MLRLMSRLALLAALAAAPAAAEPLTYRSSAGTLSVQRFAGPFEQPWAVAHLPDGAMLVTEKPGRLRLVSADGAISSPIEGAPAVQEIGQGGLLDVALSPDFAETGVIFLSLSEAVGARSRTAVARAVLDRSGAAPALRDVEIIFQMAPALDGGRHFGSRIVVAPDGALFVTLGDRGRREMAQDLGAHMGKIVRIAPSGQKLPDNPFVDRGDLLHEIWSFGHRNPQGAAIDPETGELWTVEHGARGGDEINNPRPGRNYGWPVISYGRHYSGQKIGVGTAAPGMEQPEYYWDPSIAPSGLAIYGGEMFPEWRGDIFVGALKYELIARLDRDEDGRIRGEERLFQGKYGRIRDVRFGPKGAMWFLTDEIDGWLYRVVKAE